MKRIEENNILLNQHPVYTEGWPANQPTILHVYTQSSKNAPHRLLALFSFSVGREDVDQFGSDEPPSCHVSYLHSKRSRKFPKRSLAAKCVDLAFVNEWKGNDSNKLMYGPAVDKIPPPKCVFIQRTLLSLCVCVCLHYIYTRSEREREREKQRVQPKVKAIRKEKKRRERRSRRSGSNSTREDYLSNTKSNWLSEGNVTKKEAVPLFSAGIERFSTSALGEEEMPPFSYPV